MWLSEKGRNGPSAYSNEPRGSGLDSSRHENLRRPARICSISETYMLEQGLASTGRHTELRASDTREMHASTLSPNLHAVSARWANSPVGQLLPLSVPLSATKHKRVPPQSLHMHEVAALGPAAASLPSRPGSGPSGASPILSPTSTSPKIQRFPSSGSLFYSHIIHANIAANIACETLRRKAAVIQDESLADTRWQQGPVRRREPVKAESSIHPEQH